jgi:hypothetical protein
MSYAKRLHDAKNIQDALSIIGEGIDVLIEQDTKLNDDYMSWGGGSGTHVNTVEVQHDGDNTVVDIPPVSAEERDARREFAISALKLDEYYKDGNGDPIRPKPDDPDLLWADVYATGGPVWLYENDREFVMTLSPSIKQHLVADVTMNDPKYAHEMARDILKADADDSRAAAKLESWSDN